MQSYKLNPATVRKIYIVVQSIFRRGVEQGFVRESPCRNVVLPKNRYKSKKPVLDEQQTKDFLALLDTKYCDKDIKCIIKVLLFTGMRCGECLALFWSDINYGEKPFRSTTISCMLTESTFSQPRKPRAVYVLS